MSKVLIAIPTSDRARQAIFYDYIEIMDKPPDSMKSSAHGQSPARNRNLMIQQALDHDCSHVLFVDDDVIVPRNLLTGLLSHNVPVVTGLYLMRNFPHQPIIFDANPPHGNFKHHYLKDNENGLVPIVNCGLGCVLIETWIFKQMEKPWITLGELEADHWCDDISFFNRLRLVTTEMYCDTNLRCGHMGDVTIYPVYEDGKWYVEYDTTGLSRVRIPSIISMETAVAQ